MEHRRRSSESSEVSWDIQQDSPGCLRSMDDIKILDRDTWWFETGVKEATVYTVHKNKSSES